MSNPENYLATLKCYSQTFPRSRVHLEDYRSIKNDHDSVITLKIKESDKGVVYGDLNTDKSDISTKFEGQITQDNHGRFNLKFIKLEGSVDIQYSLIERSPTPKENKNFCYLEGTWHPDPYVDSRYKGLACVEVSRLDLEQLL